MTKTYQSNVDVGIGGNAFHLAEDFDLACELGHGQFMWQTANYLKDEPAAGEAEAGATAQSPAVETPPERANK